MTESTSASTRCGAAWSVSAASRSRTRSDAGVSAITSNSALASTTSIGPLAAQVVECLDDIVPIDLRRPPPSAREPFLDGGARSQTRRLLAQQFRNRHAGGSRAAREPGIDVVVDIA